MKHRWTAGEIGNAIVNQTFNRSILLVPNCLWPGSECDVLGVHPSLRLIDVEIKISRADLKCDPDKEKWIAYKRNVGQGSLELSVPTVRVPRGWPHRIWKHYYAAPEDCFTTEIVELLPPASGLIAMRVSGTGMVYAVSLRRARPNPDAKPIESHEVIDIARLASLRMWQALKVAHRNQAVAA